MIYVCSDIHGILSRYQKAIRRLKKDDTLYILGDVIDRNPDGIEILKDIMQRPNVVLLCGNHENFMYEYLFLQRQQSLMKNKTTDIFHNDDSYTHLWFHPSNGGIITYEAFLKESDEDQMKIFEFLSKLPLIALLKVNKERYHLSHAGTTRLDFDQYKKKRKPVHIYRSELKGFEVKNIVWACPYKVSFYLDTSSYPEDYTCVFGHVATQRITDIYTNYKIYKSGNLISIDGGCAYYIDEQEYPNEVKTALSFLCLDTHKVSYIK